jgi:hypothetical protein
MSAPDSDEGKRGWSLPIWSAKPNEPVLTTPDPPVTRFVSLPDRVSITYLAEITVQDPSAVIGHLVRLRLFLGIYRGLDFEAAAKFLRKYGIGANKTD